MDQHLGAMIRLRRQETGQRLADISILSGFSEPTIRLCENGRGNIKTLVLVLAAMGLKLGWSKIAVAEHPGFSIAKRRSFLRLSQRDLAGKVGVSHSTIVALETKFIGRVTTLERCLQMLRLRPVLVEGGSPVDDRDSGLIWSRRLNDTLSASSGDSNRVSFIHGDAQSVLRQMPDNQIDCVVTSPPYWGHREYHAGGLGSEPTIDGYIRDLAKIIHDVHRVLRPKGSLWLNLGDTYVQKSLAGVPWRVALHLVKQQGWLLRSDVIWHKPGGGLNVAVDRMSNKHEHLFHFTKATDYYFDADPIRNAPQRARLDGLEPATATGMTFRSLSRKVDAAVALSDVEKDAARAELTQLFMEIASGDLHDFRLIVRGVNRVTHSEDLDGSSRARLLRDRGYYILRYDPKGSLPGDVWSISPEKSRGRELHYAAYPTELCRIPILATCPPDGIVLDPFCGTGSTMVAALELGRRGIGIDLSEQYLQIAATRCGLNGGDIVPS